MAERIMEENFFKEDTLPYGLFAGLVGEAKDYEWLGIDPDDPITAGALATIASAFYVVRRYDEILYGISGLLGVDKERIESRCSDTSIRYFLAFSEAYKRHSGLKVGIEKAISEKLGKDVPGMGVPEEVIEYMNRSNSERKRLAGDVLEAMADFLSENVTKVPVERVMGHKGYTCKGELTEIGKFVFKEAIKASGIEVKEEEAPSFVKLGRHGINLNYLEQIGVDREFLKELKSNGMIEIVPHEDGDFSEPKEEYYRALLKSVDRMEELLFP